MICRHGSYLLIGLLSLGIAGRSLAQDNPVEQVRLYGPESDLLTSRDIVPQAIQMLKWQQRLVAAQIADIEKMQADWQKEIEATEVELAELDGTLQQGGWKISLEPETLNNLSERKIDSTIEVEALHARASALEDLLAKALAEQTERGNTVAKTERLHLQSMLEVLEKEHEQLSKLREKGAVPETELRQAELRISEARLQLERANQQQAMRTPQVAELENELAEVGALLRSRKQALFVIEASLNMAEPSVAKAAKLKRRLAFLEELTQQSNSEIVAIRWRHSENTALLRLCEEALKNNPK